MYACEFRGNTYIAAHVYYTTSHKRFSSINIHFLDETVATFEGTNENECKLLNDKIRAASDGKGVDHANIDSDNYKRGIVK